MIAQNKDNSQISQCKVTPNQNGYVITGHFHIQMVIDDKNNTTQCQ
jgi:hypothetical protein